MKPLLVSLLGLLSATTASLTTRDVSDFDWSTIEASPSLNYTPCYDTHKCAKLLVPLDWLDPKETEDEVSLAIITLPATVPETDASFAGSILVNPGGPSGSGVDFLLTWGSVLQRTADSAHSKHEMVSFDPRGVGLTEPAADCFRSEFARGAFSLEDRALGSPGDGIRVVRSKISRAGAVGRLCQAGDDKNRIQGFMSTSSVARDMVAIVDKLDELRKESVEPEQLELRGLERDDTPRLQYWGFSYGSVLGNYFASMFPGRVGRMVLEAVEDPYDYLNATWALNMVDTQKALDHFWETCHKGGPRCALSRNSDTSPKDVRTRVEAFMERLETSPAPYVSGTVTSITKQDVLDALFHALYFPLQSFPPVASIIDQAMRGNFSGLYAQMDLPSSDDSCELRGPEKYTWWLDAQTAIACGDGDALNNVTAEQFNAYIRRLEADSPDFGAKWSTLRLACLGWPVRPKYRFAGPFTTPPADARLVKGKPAAPILFVSSRVDPATPLANARAAAAMHPGAAVLVQESVGHSAAVVPSRCREREVARYFATGELPDKEMSCEPDCRPFEECEVVGLGGRALRGGEGKGSRGRRAPLGIFG